MDEPTNLLEDEFLLFFEQEQSVHFLNPARDLEYWLDYFGPESFIGGVRCEDLEDCEDIIGLLLQFFDPFIEPTKKTRKINGNPEQLKEFFEKKMGSIFTFYQAEGLIEWKERSRKNRVTEGLKT